MRRLLPWLLAAALAALLVPALAPAQAVDPGTPTTIAPAATGTAPAPAREPARAADESAQREGHRCELERRHRPGGGGEQSEQRPQQDRPETGEERFHSFAGVPIIRRERAVGVLAVQHAEQRKYADVEIEALQTVAMVLSELIANAGFSSAAACSLR